MLEQLLVNGRLGFRANTTKAFFVFGVLLVLLAVSVGALSARQPSTVSLDVGFSSLRLLLCLMALIWLQELLGRAIEQRFVYQLLVFPQPRYRILLMAYGSVALLLLISVLVFALLLLVAVNFSSSYIQVTPPNLGWAYWLTWAFMYIDILVVVAFAILILTVSTTPFFALILAFAFYIIGHSLSSIIDLLTLSSYAEASHQTTILPVLRVLRYVIPDLNGLDLRDWSLYGEAVDGSLVLARLAMSVLYAAILLLLSGLLMSRREFP